MREDEQRFEFEELESKLAALSSQVESLRLEKEIDPFFEDDVRRLIEDFREREIDAGLDEEPEGFDDQQELQNSDYISVVRTEDPSFKVHWITPESCEEMTKEKAKEAFVIGAASRYGTSQQVRGGDVLILLCRKPVPEEPESSESSEPVPAPPTSEFCHYIGMAVNTFVGPSSAEPEPTPDPDSEELIAKKFGNFEIFVWSSCECSSEPASTVVIPSVFETGSSSSSSHGKYASVGGSASPDMSSADGLLTSAEIRKDSSTGATKLAKGLSNTLTISTQNAGYKTELVQLSQDLTEYYLDRKTKDLSFDADKKELNKHEFASDIFTSKSLTLSNGDCGNLEAVSISGETFDIALLKEGGASLESTFLTTAKISLGAAVSLGDSLAIETYQSLTGVIESTNTLEDEHTVFLPIISDTDADTILETDTLDSQAFNLTGATVSSDASGVTVSIGTSKSIVTANYSSGLLTHKDSPTVSLGNIRFTIPNLSSGTSGTSSDYNPALFKTSVNSKAESAFYEKSVSILSSSDALIDFVNGVAVSLNNPSYSLVNSLVIDASNNNGTAEVTKLSDISVRGEYDVIYEDEGTGDARYYVDYTFESVSLTIQNGLVTSSAAGSSTTETEGPIIVPGADLKYGCHPEYGCQPDPSGEFFDSSCGSGCPPPNELMLRYRPKNIWRYDEINDSSGTCYEEIANYELDPTQSTATTQGYTNGGIFKAELVGDKQVDNFYANGVLIPFEELYFSELGAEQLCYELTFRPSSVDLYFKAHDPTQPDNFCLRLVSEHLKEAGDTTNRTQAYTKGGEMREVISVGAGGVVTTKSIFYVDGVPRDPDAAGSSWVLGFDDAVPTVAAICTEVSEINYSATGEQSAFSDTITYAETESPQKVSVTLQYNDINNATGSSYRFEDSSGAELAPLESYVYAEGNDPYLFTIEIPQGSTGLNVYVNDQGSAGTSTWDINLSAQ